MNTRFSWVVLLGLVVGCDADPKSGTKAAPAKAPARADASKAKVDGDAKPVAKDPVAKKTVAMAAGKTLAPLRFDPAASGDGVLPHAPTKNIEDDLGSPTPHVTTWGWSGDGSQFLMCIDDGSDAGACTAHDASGKEVFAGAGDDAGWTSVLAKAGELSHGPTDWAHGEVSVTWVAKDGALQLGAKVDGQPGKANVATLLFPEAEDDADLFVEVAALSSDRTAMAVVGQAAIGESSSVVVSVVAVGDFVAEGYSAAGFAELKKESFTDAAAWFQKATDAGAGWKHPYNLACARSRGGLDDTQAALELAIERGGATARKKAATDDDLKALRGQEWFVAAVK